MSWYRNTLTKYGKEIKQSAVASFVLSLVFLIYTYSVGHTFSWQEINPIEQPSIFARAFYSALAFVIPGSFLYHKLKFWKFLYAPYRGGGRKAYREYTKTKRGVWALLILLTYSVIVPFIVDILNAIVSFFYNIFNLILYLSPTLGVFLILLIVGVYLIKRFKLSPMIIKN
jgi:hypothetical protein